MASQLPEKPKGSTQAIVAGVAVLLIFSLTFFYLYTMRKDRLTDENYYTYKDFVFVKNGALWVTQVQAGNRLYSVPLHYGPRDLADVEIKGAFSRKFADAAYAYITIDPLPQEGGNGTGESQMGLAAAELSIVLAQAISRMPIAACTANITEECAGRPIIACERYGEPVIYLREGGDAAVTFNGDCIELSGEGSGLVRATDRLLLYWLSVMR